MVDMSEKLQQVIVTPLFASLYVMLLFIIIIIKAHPSSEMDLKRKSCARLAKMQRRKDRYDSG